MENRIIARLLIAAVIFIIAIARGGLTHHKAKVTTTSGGDRMVEIEGEDPRLQAATDEAKRRWGEFTQAWKSPGQNKVFTVKHAFAVNGGHEHIWIMVNAMDGTNITGQIANEPDQNIGYKLGEAVTIPQSDIEDWGYGPDVDHLTGNFSGKVLDQIEKEGK